jgi:hypothetical protein
MSNGVSNSDLIDLQKTTLQNLPKQEFEVALTQQEYHVINKWFPKDKQQLDSGTSIERNIILDPQGNAQHVRLFQKLTSNVPENQKKVTAPWCQVTSSYAMERREILRNRKPAAYISLLKSRRVTAAVALANLLEDRAFRTPDSSDDDLNPRGIPYHLTKVDSGVESAGDFIGKTVRYGDGTTTTTKAGISAANNANWRNYAFTYSSVNRELIKRMSRAFYATQFKSPILAKDLKDGPLSNFRIYVPLNVLVDLEDQAQTANENLGPDLLPFHGVTAFKRIPLLHTPQLNADADQPIYAANHDKFYPYILEGDWMREDEPMNDVEQPDTFTTRMSGSYQYFCGNLRLAGFVGSLVPTA